MAGWRLEITLPEKLYKKLEELSQKEKIRKSEVIKKALEEYFKTK